jgi:hypothetical protein
MVALLGLCSLAAIVLLLRRLRQAHGLERQQLKWVVFAMAIVAAANVADFAVRASGAPLLIVTGPGLTIAVGIVPIAMGVAIFRYQLFDIDRLISRTLVYVALTALLGLGYLLSVVLLQRLLNPVTRGSDLAVAGATLGLAALARPARGRIRAAVDRRFNRRRYDAARTIDAFSTRLREELDLAVLTADMCAVANDTMQPTHVSLWLRDEAR